MIKLLSWYLRSKELQQIHDMETYEPVDQDKTTAAQRNPGEHKTSQEGKAPAYYNTHPNPGVLLGYLAYTDPPPTTSPR